MPLRRIARNCAVALAAALLSACAHHVETAEVAQVTIDPTAIAAEARVVPVAPASGLAAVRHMAPQATADTDAPYMLDGGDKVRVFVYGQPNLSRVYSVDGGGFISLPLIGAVKARGETTFDLERAITVQLGAKYVRDPKVSVEIASYRPFYILGEVRAAGQYPYATGMTVQTAVAIAGGYSERASERSVIVTRRVNGLVEKLELSPDSVVLPGDTVYVRERYF
jgi:polysaccharide export outer membrane protein